MFTSFKTIVSFRLLKKELSHKTFINSILYRYKQSKLHGIFYIILVKSYQR